VGGVEDVEDERGVTMEVVVVGAAAALPAADEFRARMLNVPGSAAIQPEADEGTSSPRLVG
jgi:hypothetical protein